MSRRRRASSFDEDELEVPASLSSRAVLSLRQEEMEKLVGTAMRYMLARHLSKQMVARTDISRLFDENIRQKRIAAHVFKLAQKNFKERLGMKVVEVQRRVRPRGGSGMSQAARSVMSQASVSQSGGNTKHYILVSALPADLRPEPNDKAVVGLITVIANLIVLNVHFRVEEGVLLTYLEKLGVEKGRIYSHPQIGNVSQLLETDFPKQGYFEREKDGEEYYYTLGPRLRGEISSGNLVDIINEIYGNDMDETSRKELMLRIDGITDENEE